MNCKFIRYLITVTACVAISSLGAMPAGAQDSETTVESSPFIQHFDLDGDGLVSADEFPGEQDHFSSLDIDGDGYLDASESPSGPPPGGPDPADILAEFDEDGDGLISLSEFMGPEDHFDRLDADGDGYLNSEELSTGRPGPPPGRGGPGFDMDDADQDGMVSEAEFSGPEELFNQLDADGDGYITREEVRSGSPRPAR